MCVSGEFVHINKARIHGFRNSCATNVAEQLCVSCTWDWVSTSQLIPALADAHPHCPAHSTLPSARPDAQCLIFAEWFVQVFFGDTAESVATELQIALECAQANVASNAPSRGTPHTVVHQLVKATLAVSQATLEAQHSLIRPLSKQHKNGNEANLARMAVTSATILEGVQACLDRALQAEPNLPGLGLHTLRLHDVSA